MTMGQAAVAGLAFGATTATAFMGAYIIRAAYTMTRRNGWYELRKL